MAKASGVLKGSTTSLIKETLFIAITTHQVEILCHK